MLVIGDLHYMSNWIKKKQTELFAEWLQDQECFKTSKTILLLGDLFEIPTPASYLVAFYLKLFTKDWADKNIIIVKGNHDSNTEEDALDHFMFLDNVTIVKEKTEMEIEGLKCLLLPHYDHEGTDKPPMTEYYSSLSGEYDYIFAHVMDETQNFGKAVCDLSKIKGKRLFGHVHTANVRNGGNYLGSAVKNSSTEKEDQKLLALITKNSLDYVEVPSFMEYETVVYGEDVKCTDKLVLVNVTEAPTKSEAENYYQSKYPKLKVNKVTTKRQRVLATEAIQETSEADSWKAFCEEKKIPESVQAICARVLN